MRGVAVDCTNRPPSARQIRNVGLDSIRIEMRDLPSFYAYTDRLSKDLNLAQTWLVGPSTGPVEPILAKSTVTPAMVIIGNEPDIVGNSSWTMAGPQYIDLWNSVAPLIHARHPTATLVTAGMYHATYAWDVYSRLWPIPGLLNMHYPSGIDAFKEFSRNHPCIVGEWCWRTATPKEMHDWVHHFLNIYAWDWFWFCWGDYMVPNMGLVTPSGQRTKAYYNLRGALA